MLNIKNLRKYYNNQIILKDVDFNVSQGDRVVIIGPSGSGKSTLARCISGLEPVDGGEILYKNKPITDVTTDIGIVFQSFDLFKHLTALENIILAPKTVKKVNDNEARSYAMELLKRVGLADRADYYPEQLSGGQQQRVAIARALAMEPELLIFDEPTSALDPEMTTEVLNTISNLVRDGMTVIIISHEMEFARKVSNRIVFMDQGSIIEDSPTSEIGNEETPRLNEFLETINQN